MPLSDQTLATLVFMIHFGVVLFNVGGLVAIPLGGLFRWGWVRIFWWRILHLLSLGVVAAQAVLGQVCFLTIWQATLAGRSSGETPPLAATWVNSLLYWPLPLWVYALIYVAVLAYTLALWRWVPPRRPIKVAA